MWTIQEYVLNTHIFIPPMETVLSWFIQTSYVFRCKEPLALVVSFPHVSSNDFCVFSTFLKSSSTLSKFCSPSENAFHIFSKSSFTFSFVIACECSPRIIFTHHSAGWKRNLRFDDCLGKLKRHFVPFFLQLLECLVLCFWILFTMSSNSSYDGTSQVPCWSIKDATSSFSPVS